MRTELVILAITAFFIFNTYYDGKYSKMLLSYKKYYQMAFIGLLGVSFYVLLKRNPTNCRNMLVNANNVIKYMPIDKSSLDLLSPIMDFTNMGGASGGGDGGDGDEYGPTSFMQKFHFMNSGGAGGAAEKRILQSGMNTGINGGKVKRSVSETKKKYVASMQDWKCGHCKSKLNAWFEVDHIKSLENGGSNDVANLVALCRDCHGRKTAMENM